jgi:putative ABC transport system permease protein
VGFDIDGTMAKGRWYTAEEQQSNASVVVLAQNFAELSGLKVGDTTDIMWPTGTYSFEVIGINKAQMNNGICCYIPINTVQDKMQMDDAVNGFVIKTDNEDHETIDKAATAIEDELMSRGYVITNLILYVVEEQNIRNNQQIVNLMIAVGSLIILITMIGLMSTLTMNVIERTKEIGMMRCVGSSSWSVRSVFGTEGLVLSIVGWGLGIPIGFLIGNFLNYMVDYLMHVTIIYLFPPVFVVIALGITVVLTVIVIQPPLWRATHFKPGEALRYE